MATLNLRHVRLLTERLERVADDPERTEQLLRRRPHNERLAAVGILALMTINLKCNR